MSRNRRWHGDPLQVPAVVVDDDDRVVPGGEGGRWYCCGSPWPDHDPRCVRLAIRDGDLHQWAEGDPYPHQQSPVCPCGPERFEVFPSLANPNWEGCGWSHRKMGA